MYLLFNRYGALYPFLVGQNLESILREAADYGLGECYIVYLSYNEKYDFYFDLKIPL